MRRISLRYHLFKLCIITAYTLLFTGCFSSSVNSTQSIPQWFINAPQNNGTFIYGSGEAPSFQMAQNIALNDMAARLSVNVRSSINQNTQSYSNASGAQSYSKSVNQNIEVNVEEMGFTNAKVVQSTVRGNSFFVLMQVNRNELFNNKKKEFDSLHNIILKKAQTASSMSTLEEIYALQALSPTLNEAIKKVKILNAINNAFDDKSYIAQYEDLQTQTSTLKQALKIRVSSNLSQRFFASQLVESLNKAQYKTVSTAAEVPIEVNSTINYSVAMGWHIAKVLTTIKVFSQGKVVSTHTITSVGRSTSTQQNALIGASRNFKSKLEQIGVDAILFNK